MIYNIKHLSWSTNYKNALFTDIDCFYEKALDETKNALWKLKERIEIHYGIKFNFDNYFLYYPHAENQNIKEFKDIIF